MDRGCDIVDWKKIKALEFHHRDTEFDTERFRLHLDWHEFHSVQSLCLCVSVVNGPIIIILKSNRYPLSFMKTPTLEELNPFSSIILDSHALPFTMPWAQGLL